MRRDTPGRDRRGAPEPLRPEEVEPVGRLLAEHYEAARRAFGETGSARAATKFLGYAFALEDHLKEHGEPVETAARVYLIGPDGEMFSRPSTADTRADRERHEIAGR